MSGYDVIFVFWLLFVLIIRVVARYSPSSSGKNQSKILQIPFASKFCELLINARGKWMVAVGPEGFGAAANLL